MEIENYTLATLLLQSFRYSLGRHTYAVGQCVEDIIKYHEALPQAYKCQIIRALEANLEYEHKCDTEQWQKLLDFLKKQI